MYACKLLGVILNHSLKSVLLNQRVCFKLESRPNYAFYLIAKEILYKASVYQRKSPLRYVCVTYLYDGKSYIYDKQVLGRSAELKQ